METTQVDYDTFKYCKDGLDVFWVSAGESAYSLATAYGTTVVVCHIDSSQEADFLTWYDVANECSSFNNACIRALFSPKAKLRLDVRQKPFTAITRNLAVVGYRHEADLDGESHFDVSFAEEREIQAASVEVKNFTDGDYIEFQAVLPANAMGPGSPEVVMVDWGKTIYLGPSGIKGYDANDAKTLPPGIIVRVKYFSVATSGPQPVLYFDLKTWK